MDAAQEIFWPMVTHSGDPVLWVMLVMVLTAVYFALGTKNRAKGKTAAYRRLLKKFLLLIIPTIIIAVLGSEILKVLIQIERPCIPCPAPGCNIYCPVTFSFPSGHTTSITAITTDLFLLLKKRKYLFIYAWAALVGASRVMLGVHTVYDVIAGFGLGIALTMIIWKYRKRLYKWEDEIL